MPSNPLSSMYRAIRSKSPKNINKEDSKQVKEQTVSRQFARDDSASVLSEATTLAPRRDEQSSKKGAIQDQEEIDYNSVRYTMRGMGSRC
ncbi:uncharacterized protein BP01DRAFT_356163 [Aspergillus saccharolyticus JOP 1030-1]|uniref:Uncharacterized protein n=1 Tax=Aspergillus saccharolyticus JOP 1030-1 TaxID=1450539 RepID=A0A318ZEJ3_9EURO|nr:hypothetical protein BP01DRAFT_356163 [Aspergillus saccharolyticus JOP 1030-1]PYH45966.1 hypothetical protein BP01DRAFT_356163 [Aspergillus saccharolyticus JOP 1030-1]